VTAPRFLADEHIAWSIIHGTRRYDPRIEFVRVVDLEMGAADEDLLEFAWQETLIIVTHDVNTMTAHANDRLQAGLHIAGLLLAPAKYPASSIAENLAMIALASEAEEWQDRVEFLPL